MRRLFAQTYMEALKGGPYGWLGAAVALRVHWGFGAVQILPEVLGWLAAPD